MVSGFSAPYIKRVEVCQNDRMHKKDMLTGVPRLSRCVYMCSVSDIYSI